MQKIVSINEVIETLNKLHGENENHAPYINTVEFLEEMKRHEFNTDVTECFECEDCEGTGEYCEGVRCEYCDGDGCTYEDFTVEEWLKGEFEEGNMKILTQDNSYNWGSTLRNDIDFTEYQNERTGEKFIRLMVHLGGDPRGNYTPYVWLACGSRVLMEALMDLMKIYTYKIDGQTYDVRVTPTSDVADVYNEDGDHVGEITVTDLDCENPIEAIKEIL